MATVTTTITPAQTPFPFSGLRPGGPDVAPTRELRCYAQTTIAAVGAGDNQYFTAHVTTPIGLCYALVDWGVVLRSAAGNNNNWPGELAVHVEDNATGTPTLLYPLQAFNRAVAQSGTTNQEYRYYSLVHLPNMVFVPGSAGVGLAFRCSSYNETANDGAYTHFIFLRLLEYTLNQANDYRVNTPIPVR